MNYLNTILETREHVKGEIYMITCSETNKRYIGQAVTHRLNHGKYRPFGAAGRFRDHMSTALRNSKQTQCAYFYNAIRKYGEFCFSYEILLRCEREQLNYYEEKFISNYDTLFPTGYNLTMGGANMYHGPKISLNCELNPISKIKNLGRIHSAETRAKMSISNTLAYSGVEARKNRSAHSQSQHLKGKIQTFTEMGVKIDENNLDQYIKKIYSKLKGVHYRIRLSGKKVDFVGKYDTEEQIYNRAVDFLKQIGKNN